MTNINARHIGNQILATGIATVLALYAIGVALPTLTPIPTFAQSDNTDDDFTNGSANDYEILSFLIAVIDCFTVNGEEFSDDVQLCLYDVIEVYFEDDGNNVNGNDDSPDSDNDNNDTTATNDNNDTPSQET